MKEYYYTDKLELEDLRKENQELKMKIEMLEKEVETWKNKTKKSKSK